MCLCCRDEALWCAGDCFETCCFKCSCSISPCCGKLCSCCKCWTCCIKCCYKWCPCCCWPPRQCMAWFLGIIGFFFMLSTLLAPEWLSYAGAGPLPVSTMVGGAVPEAASWGLYEGCVMTNKKVGDDSEEVWTCSPAVVDETVDGTGEGKIGYNDLIAKHFGWLSTVGNVLVVGEVFLVIALIIVFIGLCCPFKWRFTLFRSGMYLYLLTDLLFMIALIVFPVRLSATEPDKKLENTIGWCYGMGWGVVIIVFTGALLLLLDKDPDPPAKSVPGDDA